MQVAYFFSLTQFLVFGDGGQNSGSLFPTHHRYTSIGPHIQESRAVDGI